MHLKKEILKSLIKSNLILILLLGITILANGQVLDKIIAKVDNQIILQSELEVSYLQVKGSGEFPADMSEKDLKCRVLETLVINKMLIAKAEIDSVTVDDDMVEQELDRRMQYFIAQVGSEEKLEAYFGKTIDQLKGDLRKQVKEQLVVQKMQETITGNIKVTPSEVKKFYNSIPKDSLPYISTEVEIGHIVKIPVVGKESKNEARAKLEKIRERVVNGEDFCFLAQLYSDEPASAKNCGEIGFFNKGDLVPEYEGAALRLKPGEMSDVIETQYGFHLIQLIERKGNEFNTRHIIIKPGKASKDDKAASYFLDTLRRNIIRGSIKFEKAATLYSDDKNTQSSGGMFYDKSEGTYRIPLEDLDPSMFFTIDTMKQGSICPPVSFKMETGEWAYRIIYYKKRIPPHQANLKDDYQRIAKATLTEKKNNALNEWFDKTKNEVFIDLDQEYSDCKILMNQ